MGTQRDTASAFVAGYRRAWEAWDRQGFLALFDPEIVHVVHPNEETVTGLDALGDYLDKEAAAQGRVGVRMGEPVVEGERVAAEFWVTSSGPDGEPTIVGSLIARLDPWSGRCTHFREYWFELPGHVDPFPGWGG